ncbi:hypothetical protein PJI17_32340, partial [Mycobacterium kansasii]
FRWRSNIDTWRFTIQINGENQEDVGFFLCDQNIIKLQCFGWTRLDSFILVHSIITTSVRALLESRQSRIGFN